MPPATAITHSIEARSSNWIPGRNIIAAMGGTTMAQIAACLTPDIGLQRERLPIGPNVAICFSTAFL